MKLKIKQLELFCRNLAEFMLTLQFILRKIKYDFNQGITQ